MGQDGVYTGAEGHLEGHLNNTKRFKGCARFATLPGCGLGCSTQFIFSYVALDAEQKKNGQITTVELRCSSLELVKFNAEQA